MSNHAHLKSKALKIHTMCGIRLILIFCSTGHWADSAAYCAAQLMTGTSERNQKKTSRPSGRHIVYAFFTLFNSLFVVPRPPCLPQSSRFPVLGFVRHRRRPCWMLKVVKDGRASGVKKEIKLNNEVPKRWKCWDGLTCRCTYFLEGRDC